MMMMMIPNPKNLPFLFSAYECIGMMDGRTDGRTDVDKLGQGHDPIPNEFIYPIFIHMNSLMKSEISFKGQTVLMAKKKEHQISENDLF